MWSREKSSLLRQEETQKQKWARAAMAQTNNSSQNTIHVNHPPPSFIYEQSPLRMAAADSDPPRWRSGQVDVWPLNTLIQDCQKGLVKNNVKE